MIVSENHIDKINYVALCFALSIHSVQEKSQKNDCLYHTVYKWDPAKKDQYIQNFHDVNASENFDSMLCAVPNQATADEFCKLFYIFLEGAIQKVSKKQAVKTTSTFPNNQWFDDDCKQMKSSINAYASSHDITEAYQGLIYKGMCKEYKRLIQSKKRNHRRKVRLEVAHMATNNSQQYWEFWKKHKKPLQSDINITEFNGYFATQAQPPTKPYFKEMDLSNSGAEAQYLITSMGLLVTRY